MSKIVRSEEYRVSERVLIKKGDKFKASKGPYWVNSEGEKVPWVAKGPFTFIAHCKRDRVEWLECLDRDGHGAVLHIAGRRATIMRGVVGRHYKIVGKTRTRPNQ